MAFRNVEGSGGLLFLHEAAALFGSRTSVRDAHDRYANLEASYLLRCFGSYHGAAILASNSERNLAPAF